jgi:hypothetical protein
MAVREHPGDGDGGCLPTSSFASPVSASPAAWVALPPSIVLSHDILALVVAKSPSPGVAVAPTKFQRLPATPRGAIVVPNAAVGRADDFTQ